MNIHKTTHNSRIILFKDTLIRIDYNKEDEIINVWSILGDAQHKITNLMTEHFPELRRLK